MIMGIGTKPRGGVWFKQYKVGKFIISYKHPQVRSWANLLFYGIVDAIAEFSIKPSQRRII